MVETNFDVLEKSLRKEIEKTGKVTKNGKLTTYKSIVHEGYLGDFATEWWTEKDYEDHRKFVEESKARGTYGKPSICELSLLGCPQFDEPNHGVISGKPLMSYSFELIDLSGKGKNKIIKSIEEI